MQLSTKGAKHFIDTIGQWKQTKAEEIKTERFKKCMCDSTLHCNTTWADIDGAMKLCLLS